MSTSTTKWADLHFQMSYRRKTSNTRLTWSKTTLAHSLWRVRAWQGATMTDWGAAAASANPPSPCRWDINQALLLCKDFRVFWSMSTLGKWEVCPFVKLALRDIFTNYIQGLFRRKLEPYVISVKVLDSIKNDQWLREFPFLCFTVSLCLVQKYYAKL